MVDWNKWCHSSLWGHHYAIWASDSNFLLAQQFFFGPAKGWPSFQALYLDAVWRLNDVINIWTHVRPKKNICVFTVTCQKKSRVGRHYFFFKLSAKLEIVVAGCGIRFLFFIFEIFVKPSFVETVLWRVTQFFYLLCSQFRQKASGWINKTLLLIKQQKWLSEFCVKIDRVASKN
jgi:hypothetical protein